MNVDIFIRTYHKDLEWLKYALKSIRLHVTGYRNIVITIPDESLIAKSSDYVVIQVEDLKDGYLGQQFTKMNAHLYTDADAVLFWDSDLIACEPVDISEWTLDGKPIILKTSYHSIEFTLNKTPLTEESMRTLLSNTLNWKKITEKALGFSVESEYMRRLPFFYFTDTIAASSKWIENKHKVTLREYLNSQPYRTFSEFNAIGAYAEKFESDRYAFIDTDTNEIPKNKLHQFWSWSGLDSNDLKQIKQYIG